MKSLTIATRDSLLALWQTHFVRDALHQRYPTLTCEIAKMKTQGDMILDKPLNQIGGKALFMKELEVAMLEGRAHLAVHSLKDVPYELPQGFTLAAFCPREDARDAFVSSHYANIDALPQGAIVGTSSLRRKAQLLAYRPDLNIQDLRGNVQTRLRKLDEGQYDAIVLAAAGLIRLEQIQRIRQFIDPNICLPAVGQGIVVIECLESDAELIEILSALNHTPSHICAQTERAFNETLKGGCHVPIAAHATLEGNTITLEAMVASADGKEVLREKLNGNDATALGQQLAKQMIAQGAYRVLGIDSSHFNN